MPVNAEADLPLSSTGNPERMACLPEYDTPVVNTADADAPATLLDGSFLTEAVELAPAGIALLHGPDHRFTYANRAYRHLRKPGSAFIGQPAATVFPEFAIAGRLPLVDEVYATRRTVRRREFAVLRETGEQAFYDFDHVPLAGADGSVRAVLVLASDVTDKVTMRQAAEVRAAEAEKAQQLLEGLLAFIPEGVILADAPDVTIRHVSAYGTRMTGRPAAELEGIPAHQHVERWDILRSDGVTRADPEDLPLTRATRRGEVVTNEEWVLRRVDGQALTILCNAGPIRAPDGTITGGVIAWRDISAARQVQAELRDALAQKELLLGEVNHRVRNSLQLVSSLLGLQARETTGAETRRELEAAAARVGAIAKLHERLYKGPSVERVEFGAYLRSLCQDLGEAASEHIFEVEVAAVDLPTDTAVALGLVFVELVANAIKHANPVDDTPRIFVHFGSTAAGGVALSVRDYGVGLPPGFVPGQGTRGFGMRVILGMARQLGAELRAGNAAPGARWTLHLPGPGQVTPGRGHMARSVSDRS